MEVLAGSWPCSYEGVIPFCGEALVEAGAHIAAPPAGRRSQRVRLEVAAGLRQRGASSVTVEVMDLSTDGFRVLSHLDLQIGLDVWLRLPGLEPFHATVAWTDGLNAGCKFAKSLHPAVLQMIVSKSQVTRI